MSACWPAAPTALPAPPAPLPAAPPLPAPLARMAPSRSIGDGIAAPPQLLQLLPGQGTQSGEQALRLWEKGGQSLGRERVGVGPHLFGGGDEDRSIATSQAIPADSSTPFTGMCRFETSGSVVVTVYAYQSTSAVDGNAVAFPYGLSYSADKSINHTYPAVYSGKGTGYYLTFTHGTKYVSDLLSRPYIYTSNAQGGYGNSNEMIPIKMIQGGLTADPN